MAPAARNAPRTVARSLAAPQALVIVVVGAECNGGGGFEGVFEGGSCGVLGDNCDDGGVVLAPVVNIFVVVVVVIGDRAFCTRAVSRVCLSFAVRLFHSVEGVRPGPWPWPWSALVCVAATGDGDDDDDDNDDGDDGDDDDVVALAAFAAVAFDCVDVAFVVFVGETGGGGGIAKVAHAHRALGSSPGPCMRAHDPT